jgi:hypothetical protein
MYKLVADRRENVSSVTRLLDGACIPFDPDNSDYQQFKKDLVEGVELQDSIGTAMTQAQITTFLETIP